MMAAHMAGMKFLLSDELQQKHNHLCFIQKMVKLMKVKMIAKNQDQICYVEQGLLKKKKHYREITSKSISQYTVTETNQIKETE